MAERDWSERDLAAHMGVAYSYVNRVLNGKRHVGARAIAGFLQVGLEWHDILTVIDD
jgi:plasmid maintenance system antidote protein VapI